VVLALDKPQVLLVAGGYEMAISTIDKSQRTAARIAGLAFPISFVIVVAVNFGIFARLIVSGNPAETARNILAHETLFRIGIAENVASIRVLAKLRFREERREFPGQGIPRSWVV
jgi:hypothetical protein